MNKFKILGVTEYGRSHLSEEDIMSIEGMIGFFAVNEGDTSTDGCILYNMPDGQLTHEEFLELDKSENK